MNLFRAAHFLLTNMTAPEEALEPAVAALGERYRSQFLFPGLKHIADFVLLDRKVIIEVDGKSHSAPKQKFKDLKHTMALQARGYTVFRCTNEEAKANPEGIVQAALVAPQTETAVLQAALDQLLRDYPKLAEPRARRPRRPKRQPRPRAAKSGGKGPRSRGALPPSLPS